VKTKISKSEFKAKALEILRSVEETGQPVLITDRGQPTVEIRRYKHQVRTAKEILKGTVLALEGPTEPIDEPWNVLP
jgi:prevent-host-death family protein